MLCLPRDKYLAILYLSKESFSYPKEHFSDYPLPYCAEIIINSFENSMKLDINSIVKYRAA